MRFSLLCRTFGKAVSNAVKHSKVQRSFSVLNATNDYTKYETIAANECADRVMSVELNRPNVRNAIDMKMFEELQHCFKQLDRDKRIRAVVLSGREKMFTAGLDLMSFQQLLINIETNDVARRALELRTIIEFLQQTTRAIGNCQKPVIAVTHGGCIGAGIDMISAADIRYCSQDAWFQVKEVDIGIAADLGTLQYMPLVVGNDSIVRELVFTGRKMHAMEALHIGFVGKVLPDYETAKVDAIETAKLIVAKSPIAVQGAKIGLNESRDQQIVDGLRFQKVWNMSSLQSEDVAKAGMAVATKSSAPSYDDL